MAASQFGQEADEILARGASTWSNHEARLIEGLMKEFGRDKVKQVMIEVRGGEKPTLTPIIE